MTSHCKLSCTGVLEVLQCVLVESPEVLNVLKEGHVHSIISFLDKHGCNHKVTFARLLCVCMFEIKIMRFICVCFIKNGSKISSCCCYYHVMSLFLAEMTSQSSSTFTFLGEKHIHYYLTLNVSVCRLFMHLQHGLAIMAVFDLFLNVG